MDELEKRIETLERAVTDGDHDLSALAAEGETVDRLETVESRLEDLEERVEELDAATQALRGYVGNIRSVNEDVEKRADAALAKVESLEAERQESQPVGQSGNSPATHGRKDSPPRQPGGDSSAGAVGDASPPGQLRDATSVGQPGSDSPVGQTDSPPAERSEPASHGRQPAGVGGQTGTAGGTHSSPEHRCHACGRPDPTVPDGGTSSAAADTADGVPRFTTGDEQADVPNPEPSDSDAGTLQRIRQML